MSDTASQQQQACNKSRCWWGMHTHHTAKDPAMNWNDDNDTDSKSVSCGCGVTLSVCLTQVQQLMSEAVGGNTSMQVCKTWGIHWRVIMCCCVYKLRLYYFKCLLCFSSMSFIALLIYYLFLFFRLSSSYFYCVPYLLCPPLCFLPLSFCSGIPFSVSLPPLTLSLFVFCFSLKDLNM